jgi:class 3 adenylate cyclase
VSRLEKLLYLLFPALRLSATPWYGVWLQRERDRLLLTSRVAFAFCAVAYATHYFLIDVPLGLGSDERWAWYRFGMTGLGLLSLALTMSPSFSRSTSTRWPLAVFSLVASFAQAWSMTWYAGVPYPYAFVLPNVAALLLRMSVLKSVFWLVLVFALQSPAFARTNIEPQLLTSALVVSLLVVTLLRSHMASEIDSFLSEQEKLEAQKKLIESEIELSREVRAFLPREVYSRIETEMRQHRKTVLQAMDEGLRPRLKIVACLFSDIRGFTQRSRDVDGFLAQGALPNIRDCTDIVEAHRGIPRLIGDLVFAYYDGEAPEENLRHALESGFALTQRTTEWNRTQPLATRVNRYVLISYGECLVGNIGGFDSSREITALGSPVNILSRIDPLTKEPSLKAVLKPEAIILTRAAAVAARRCGLGVRLTEIDLKSLDLSMRDFPEETSIWLAEGDGDDRHPLASTNAESTISMKPGVPS